MKPKKNLLVGCCAALVAFVLCGGIGEQAKWREPFSAAKWAEFENDGERRYGMLADLIYRRKLIGLTKAQVIALLDKPNQEDGCVISYDVGPAVGDSETLLIIHFDVDGRASIAEVKGKG